MGNGRRLTGAPPSLPSYRFPTVLMHPSACSSMPSTHSAVITYFALYICLACARLSFHHAFPLAETYIRAWPPAVVVPLASTIALSRIWLGHHTVPQVGAGVVCGLVFTPVWFWLWTEGGMSAWGHVAEVTVNQYLGW